MKTHTVRNKSSARPIVTLSPKLFEQVLSAHPEAAALTLSWFKRQYKLLTGKDIALDYDQAQALLKRADANEAGVWQSQFSDLPPTAYRAVTVFQQGFEASSGFELPDALAVAEAFYQAMALAYLPIEQRHDEGQSKPSKA